MGPRVKGYTKRLLRAIRALIPLIKIFLKRTYLFPLWLLSALLSGRLLSFFKDLFCQRFFCEPWAWEFEAAILAFVTSFPLVYFLNKYLIVVIYRRKKSRVENTFK